ncbi:transposase [Candidatus Williamhamiltonella defendens]|uniref:transposase n=1 Tax=Candidatus Williamhamiltonella defendens TaxID=138072 RepID=UPI001581961E|nr:transposase [Candidatus Hamiltonella defensa]
MKGTCTGPSIVDSIPIPVCKLFLAKPHRVFEAPLHSEKLQQEGFLDLNDILIIHHLGEILSMRFTRGNVDDRMTAPDLGENITGQIYADN